MPIISFNNNSFLSSRGQQNPCIRPPDGNECECECECGQQIPTFLNFIAKKLSQTWQNRFSQVEMGEIAVYCAHQRKNSWKDHMMNLAKISDSKNSIWAVRPMNAFKFLPYVEVSKLTSQRMNTRCCDVGARIWSKQLFSISRNILPFFE